MLKRTHLFSCLVLLLVAVPTFAGIGVFDNAKDIGGPQGIGRTVFEGLVQKGDDPVLVEQYLIRGGGNDIWGTWDKFHMAYRTMTGDVRLSAGFERVVGANGWFKMGVMFRDPTADGDAVNYFNLTRRDYDLAQLQERPSKAAGSNSTAYNRPAGATAPKRLAIQRVTMSGIPIIEGLVDWGLGAGWERVGLRIGWNLPDEMMAGVAVTSHDNNWLGQARAFDVKYEDATGLLGPPLPTVTVDKAVPECPTQKPGFKIRAIKANPVYVANAGPWNYGVMNELLDTGGIIVNPPGIFLPGVEEGVRFDPVVNIRDTGNGAFGNDRSTPGIDPFEFPAADPAAGDDDNNYATEVLACIHLAAGLHIIGANSDDGTIIEIGGVEIGRTAEAKGASNVDFLFTVDVEGNYMLRARSLEGGGGSSLELHEVLAGAKRILLGDVAAGGSAVYIPEPATIALLGLGGLALLRNRRKS